MIAEPGWYWAEGDPIGTVRAWTGSNWVGDPEKISHKRLSTPAMITIGFLALNAVLGCLALIVRARDIDRLLDYPLSSDEVADNARRLATTLRHLDLIAAVELPLALLTGVAFVFWFHRAYVNLRWMQGSTRSSPGMAIAAWVIPLVSLYLPFRMMTELRPVQSASHDAKLVPMALIVSWWALFVGSTITSFVLSGIQTSSTAGALRWSYAAAALEGAYVICAGLAIVIVARITRYQDNRLAPADVLHGSIAI